MPLGLSTRHSPPQLGPGSIPSPRLRKRPYTISLRNSETLVAYYKLNKRQRLIRHSRRHSKAMKLINQMPQRPRTHLRQRNPALTVASAAAQDTKYTIASI